MRAYLTSYNGNTVHKVTYPTHHNEDIEWQHLLNDTVHDTRVSQHIDAYLRQGTSTGQQGNELVLQLILPVRQKSHYRLQANKHN